MIYVNGRFTAQDLTGVQRFASEMTRALTALHPGMVRVLAPPGAAMSFEGTTIVGHGSGHVWEQGELPRYANDGVLLNFGNTGPLRHKPQIVVIHDAGVFVNATAYNWRFRTGYKIMQRLLAAGQSRIATVSEASKRDLIKHLSLKPERITVLREGADHMDRIVPDETVLARHGLLPRQFVLVVGTLAAHKNLAALGPLAERLRGQGFLLVVTGGFGGSVFIDSKGHSLPHAAQYLGRVSDAQLKSLYQNAACFVMPSLYEGFGLPAIEAMACGCPVVAAMIPALMETCGDAAVFVEPCVPEGIADAVMALLSSPERRAELCRLGDIQADSMTWRGAAERLSSLIDALPERRAKLGTNSRARTGGKTQEQGFVAMRVGVIVASTNRAQEISQLLYCLRRQERKPDRIVLSVHKRDDLPADVPQDVLVISGAPGLTKQRNRGLDVLIGDCDVIVFFDDDYLPDKWAIGGIARLFQEHGGIVSATGHVLEDGVNAGGISYRIAMETLYRREMTAHSVGHVRQQVLWAYGCNMAFRAAAVGALRFDENLPLHGWQEDMDFVSRISGRGDVVKTNAFCGVHRGVNKGRSPGLALGVSQIVNPVYLVRKDVMTKQKAGALMLRNLLANHARALVPEPFIDRRGRALGNWIGLFHVMLGRADPSVILRL
jgi:glycosyltransferase involved in cell wall biosynthesis/GT2 family glycosyltransferase